MRASREAVCTIFDGLWYDPIEGRTRDLPHGSGHANHY